MRGERGDRGEDEGGDRETARALADLGRVRTAVVLVTTLVSAAPWALATHFVVLLAMAGGPAVLAAQTGAVISRALADDNLSLSLAVPPAAALLITGVAAAVDRFIEFLVGERFTALVERRVMAAVLRLPGLAFFEDPEFADRLEITRWTAGGDFSGGGGAARLYMDIAIVVRMLVGVVASTAVAARLGWWVPLAILLPIIPSAVMTWRAGAAQAAAERMGGVDRRRSDWYLDLGLSTEGGKEIRLFGLETWVRTNHHAAWIRGFEGVTAILRRHTRRELAAAAVSAMAIVAVFLSAASRAAAGELSTGDVVAGMLATPLLAMTGRSLASAPGEFRYRLANLPAVAALLDLDVPPPSGGNTAPARRAEIIFDDVTFRYPGTDRAVLEHFSLTIRSGECIALVGRNGAGKSTLVKLLCRFYEVDAGRITLDGTDIREIDIRALRRTIAVLFQEPVRYPFSAARNIAPWPQLGHDAIVAAAALAGAERVIASLPAGASTTLGREFGGEDLSGGEWQRIALARALAAAAANDTAVLVADEPTSQLDVRIEHELFTRFSEVKAGRTALLISHRFSTVRMADRIAVMENGRVIELGTHEELLAASGRYAELYQLQADAFTRRETP